MGQRARSFDTLPKINGSVSIVATGSLVSKPSPKILSFNTDQPTMMIMRVVVLHDIITIAPQSLLTVKRLPFQSTGLKIRVSSRSDLALIRIFANGHLCGIYRTFALRASIFRCGHGWGKCRKGRRAWIDLISTSGNGWFRDIFAGGAFFSTRSL